MPVPTVIGDLSTTISSNSPAGSDVPSTLDDHIRAHAGFIAQLRDGTGFAGSLTVPLNVRSAGATQGRLGVRAGTGSTQTANSSFDEVVIDSNADAGISILTGASSRGAVLFGDSGSAFAGRFQYDHSTDTASVWAAAAQRVAITSAGLSVTGKITSVTEGAGSGVTASTSYDNIVIDSENNAGLSILSGATSLGGVRFGRSSDNDAGGVNYDHATDTLTLIAGATTVASSSSAAFTVPVALQALSIESTGGLASGPIRSSGGLGFTSGAGGTVTQLTSKSTLVTLNKTSGAITMNNAALAANTAVSFTFNNSNLGPQSTVFMCIRSGATTGGSYSVIVDSVSGGSCRVSVRNLTGGSLSEALVLSFVVFDGSDS